MDNTTPIYLPVTAKLVEQVRRLDSFDVSVYHPLHLCI